MKHRPPTALLVFTTLLLLPLTSPFLCPSALAFSDENWISMGGYPGGNKTVRAVAIDGSANVYIAGDFSIAGNVFASRIAKWDGTKWSALSSGMNSTVYALGVLGNDV